MIRCLTILGGLFAFALIFFTLLLFIGLNYEGRPDWVIDGAIAAAAIVAGTIAFAAVRGSLRRQALKRAARQPVAATDRPVQ